jgi:serine/threonine-protein kinase
MVPGYTEIRELGQGGSGRVMLASHDLTGTLVAIKYLAEDLARDASFVGDFRAEAQILSELDSPYVTRLYEYLESNGRAAIVMELVDGVSMRAMIREHGAVEPEAALVVLKGSLLGLAAAHGRKVVHRDYKPANVLVDAHGHSKLADFGLAVRAGERGLLAGTPSYMAPEQWLGASATPQTDIYAATATFFECLTGRPPFVVQGNLDLLRLAHQEEPIPVELTPEPMHGLLRRGLAKIASKRPRNAAAFLRELETAASEAYGAEWEAEGRRKLARRVLLLALLLPRPTPSPAAAATSTSFAWTRLGKRTMTLTAMVVVLAGVIGARVALADQIPVSAVSDVSSISMPTTLLGSASPSPSPTTPPPVSASPGPPSPSATHSTQPKKKAPPKPTDAPPAPPQSSPPSPPPSAPAPVPSFGVLTLQGGVTSSPCTQACYAMGWQATARATGQGDATLHVGYYPVSADGTVATKPSLQWNTGFTVKEAGSISWSDSGGLTAACGGQDQVRIEATITVGGKTVISARPVTESCVIIS